ncbi:MAG: NADP-dependent malic enzyme, partial [Deltaproteobacteria bacterium]|nr:NADP-dependent malic enzyme [Deltaproteobacteria bacterium]
ALELTGQRADQLKVVFSGAGAAAIACAKMFLRVGVKKENVFLCDTRGIVTRARNCEANRAFFAQDVKDGTLADAMKGAHVFVGLSGRGLVTQAMLKTMAPKAIVFAMANPDPEIGYHEALDVRPDIVMATGRSDFPNQVNNVLGFPFIFRGTLDVGSVKINEEMKLAASHALAALAREKVPLSVCHAYRLDALQFGPEYIIPKPLDPRVLLHVAPAVAKAAMESGVATRPIADFSKYADKLHSLIERKFARDDVLEMSAPPLKISLAFAK